MQAQEQRVNDQIMQLESDRKVGQLHNMSLMSHLSVDPAALANASMLQAQSQNHQMFGVAGGTFTSAT